MAVPATATFRAPALVSALPTASTSANRRGTATPLTTAMPSSARATGPWASSSLIIATVPETEPRGADGEPHEQAARGTRQPHAPRGLPAGVRHEQKEAERQGRARFERRTRGHAMKKRHHQAQREQTRHPAHGPQSISRHALLTMRWSADIFR